MPYVQRISGAVIGVYENPQSAYAEEYLDEDNAEVLAFLNPPPSVDDYEVAIQSHVDATARSRQFRDGVTLASYVSSTRPQWAEEARAFVAWRDQVWAYAHGELSRVLGGERDQPTVTEIIAELPPISWP